MVWELRDHYEFVVGNTAGKNLKFLYGQDNAEWAVRIGDGTFLIESATASVVLESGEELLLQEMEKVDSSREGFTDVLGKGTRFGVEMLSSSGLRLRHSVSVYPTELIMVVGLVVINDGDRDLRLTSISPVAFRDGGAPQKTLPLPHGQLNINGQSALDERRVLAPAITFCFGDLDATIGLGVLRGGACDYRGEFAEKDGKLRGAFVGHYDPPLRLAPGEKAVGDPVVVYLRESGPVKTEAFLAKTQKLWREAKGKTEDITLIGGGPERSTAIAERGVAPDN